MSSLRDQVVLITGAGRGLGRALALAFAAQGARVAANDLTPVNLDDTVEQIRAAGGQAEAWTGDIAKKTPVQGILNRILDRWGRLDIVVNNAAVRPRASLLDMDEWDLQRTLNINLGGPFLLMQVAGRIMRQQGSGGVVLNIGDATPRLPGGRSDALYAATKAGLTALTRAAARELAPYGIRVNALCPGLLDTASTRERLGEEFPRIAARLVTGAPLQPAAVAEAALFLCSPAARHINGACLHVDGGGWRTM